MQTVDKALSLLNLFSLQRPTLGLTEIARLSGYNKATTRRFLIALEKHGFVEQDETTRAYGLGAGLLRLARVREAVLPIEAIVRPVLSDLVLTFGETAHFSLFTGGMLATIDVVESSLSHRVTLEAGEPIPLHATASGLVFLAFANPKLTDRLLRKRLQAYSKHTATDPNELRRQFDSVRRAGTAVAKSTYEQGVCGIAAPIFSADGFARGAVAIAAPESRVQRSVIARIRPKIAQAAIEITRATGAEPPASIVRAMGLAAA